MVVLAEACANSTKGQRPLYSLALPLLTNKSLLFDPLLESRRSVWSQAFLIFRSVCRLHAVPNCLIMRPDNNRTVRIEMTL